jgi:hypothetical protein
MDDLKAAMQDHISSALVGFSLAGAYQADETTLIEAIEGAYTDEEKVEALTAALTITLSYLAQKEQTTESAVITKLKEKTIAMGGRFA